MKRNFYLFIVIVMNLLKKVGLTWLSILAFNALELNAQSVQIDTTKNLTTELTKPTWTKTKDPLTLKVWVNAIPAVRVWKGEIWVWGLLELLSIGNSTFRLGAWVFPNYKVSWPDTWKTKNWPSLQVTYQPNKKTIFVWGVSKEGKNINPFVWARFMIGWK